MTIQDWNNIANKPSQVNVEAEEGDYVDLIDGVLFLLQTKNESNNIVAYRIQPSDKFIIWTFFKYIKHIYKDYKIEYARVEGDVGKYILLQKLFKKKEAIQDKSITDRDVYYIHLTNEVYNKLDLKCKEYEFYYTQKIYLHTEDAVEKKKAFDKMFFMVKFAVENALKKKIAALGVKRNDFYDLAMDATVNIMNRYKKPKGYETMYLLTVADYAAFGILHNAKQKFWDMQISYEAWQEYELKKEK